MKETSYLTEAGTLAGFIRIATTIGNNLQLGTQPCSACYLRPVIYKKPCAVSLWSCLRRNKQAAGESIRRTKYSYGRQIPEIQPEEVHAEASQSHLQQPEEAASRGVQGDGREKEVTGFSRQPLLARG